MYNYNMILNKNYSKTSLYKYVSHAINTKYEYVSKYGLNFASPSFCLPGNSSRQRCYNCALTLSYCWIIAVRLRYVCFASYIVC